MSHPPHPGHVIRELCIEPMDLSIAAAAAALGVTTEALSALVNGAIGISPDMAVRLSEAFGGTAESWLQQQNHYDIWCVRKRRDRPKLTRIHGLTKTEGPVRAPGS